MGPLNTKKEDTKTQIRNVSVLPQLPKRSQSKEHSAIGNEAITQNNKKQVSGASQTLAREEIQKVYNVYNTINGGQTETSKESRAPS